MTKDIESTLVAILNLPDMPSDRFCDTRECFDPWALFPCVYGSYDEKFDAMALDTLRDVLSGHRRRDDLASDMFREMLCTSGLCEYGRSPRVCFPTQQFGKLLPLLIDRWEDYAKIQWSRVAD